MSIKKRLLFILLACSILPMIFVGTLGYFNAKKALEITRIEALKSITYLKAKKIEDFFAEQIKHIKIAQRRPGIKKYTSMLAEFSGDFSSPIYETISAELDMTLNMYQPLYDYMNVILANPEGKIVYALNRSTPLKDINHILPEPWEITFEEGKKEVYISDVFRSRNRTNRLSVFIAGPIHNFDGKFVGVIAIELDLTSIFTFVQDPTGMGVTGETLVFRKEEDAALFLNPLRHDPDAALERKVVFGQNQAIAIQEALKGNSGYGFSIDYRGKKVIAVWQYIPLLDWGMVSKIDIAEAFEAATTLRGFVLILAVAVIILSIFIALIVAKSISDPIQVLQKNAEEIGRGNLDSKIGTDAKDEIGRLGRSFDQMTEKLKIITASRDELDREVSERKKAEKALQKNMSELDERVKELNCLFEISRLVEKRNLSIDEIIQGIIELIPPAWQYPDNTCAKINLRGKEVKTGNFKETIWQQTSDIIVHGIQSGNLVVGYLEERPECDEGPFLQEERALLDAIAERVGRIIERRWAQDALGKSEEKFRELMENMHSGCGRL